MGGRHERRDVFRHDRDSPSHWRTTCCARRRGSRLTPGPTLVLPCPRRSKPVCRTLVVRWHRLRSATRSMPRLRRCLRALNRLSSVRVMTSVLADNFGGLVGADSLACLSDGLATPDAVRSMLAFTLADAAADERLPVGELVGDCVSLSDALADFWLHTCPTLPPTASTTLVVCCWCKPRSTANFPSNKRCSVRSAHASPAAKPRWSRVWLSSARLWRFPRVTPSPG